MSGKKKSEVETVLRGADSSRKAIFDKRIKDLEDAFKNFENIKNTYSIEDINISSELEVLKSKKSEIKDVNKEVKALESSMKNKSGHYMDDEFFKATELLKKYENISSDLIILKGKIQDKTNEALKKHLELKKEAQNKIRLVEEQIDSIQYPDPIDPDKVLNISEICDIILDDENAAADIYNVVKKMNKNFSKNNFDAVIKDTVLLESTIEQFQQKVEKALLKINENLSTAEAVFDALGYPEDSDINGLGYELEMEFIDGKVARGIIIKTSQNSDITFTLNNIVEHDKVDIDMEVNGDCQVKVKDIQEKLVQLAIPLNITDWGDATDEQGKSLNEQIAQNKLQRG